MLVLEHRGEQLLEKRPAPGVWGGLWCFPEVGLGEDVETTCATRYGARVDAVERLPDVEHAFTHFTLTISPQRIAVRDLVPRAGEADRRWLTADSIRSTGIPTPVKRILDLL